NPRSAIQGEAPPNHAWIVVEMLAPELGADHEDRCGAGLDVVLGGQPAHERLHAEQFEGIGAEETAVQLVSAVADGVHQRGSSKAAEFATQVLEDVIMFAIVDQFRERQVRPAVRRMALVDDIERGHLVRILEGERVEDDPVKGTKNHGGGTYAQSQRQHSERGEATVFRKGTNGIAKIAVQTFGSRFPMQIAAFFLDSVERAEFHECATARILSGHAGSEVVSYALFQMELQLCVELLFPQGLLGKRMPSHGALLFRGAEND